MEVSILKPRKSLNKAFLKVKANRAEIELFKSNLINVLDKIDEHESEEFHKNLVSDFLKNTYYGASHFINTKGRNDLVIHNGNTASTTVGVIVEAKKPTNKAEMMTRENINTKAFQELVLYYLRERITAKNLEIKHLVATNIYEWFVFDANLFEKAFAQNKPLVKQFIEFEAGRLSGIKTDFFYKEIAQPAIDRISGTIEFTHFDIREYDKPLRNNDKKDDNTLIALFKLLSPEHLLKLPFANDSNSLDKVFYTELLHIIGLTETKEGGKKLIQRKKEGERNAGSLLESAMFQLDNLDKIGRLDKPSQFGEHHQERLYNVGLELSITWINRILFLKLLEAQLIKYQKGDKQYSFLNTDKVKNFDDLNNLFFSVLARKPEDRNEKVKTIFANVPYLNSSLFEPTEIEQNCFFISQLTDGNIPLLSTTVIKNSKGQKLTGELIAIEYIFEFLNAYDFASEGSEDIQEDNKRLINASVLGLIFEKINGYKDGSFFTPGFITMYMCRETIRRAVVQKFNETKAWNCTDLHGLYDKIEDRAEANAIVNSIKLCDPAVGSGHFLVSALNELIAIKSELKILSDRDGKRLKEYSVEVENDELIVTDDDGQLFAYNPTSKESQRIQETLFHEKQTLIENCLFGVDLNPNSVKICRLRLWIELLKNAYYHPATTTGNSLATATGHAPLLETLPNIDINIKCGNSLISRYALDADIKKALKRSKWTIDSYRLAVMTYRNAKSKDEKWAMEKLIKEIKNDFESEIAISDKRILKLSNARGELLTLTTQTTLFEKSKKEKTTWNKQVNLLTETISKLEKELEEIRNNKIYENAFEWRFEFPEVLNDDGDFVGFDVVIGNPPYISYYSGMASVISVEEYAFYIENYKFITNKKAKNRIGTVMLFLELSTKLLKVNGEFSSIIDLNIFSPAFEPIRMYLNDRICIHTIVSNISVFEDVGSGQAIFSYSKAIPSDNTIKLYSGFESFIEYPQTHVRKENNYNYQFDLNNTLIEKIVHGHYTLENSCSIISGMNIGGVKDYFLSENRIDETYHLAILSGNIFRYEIKYPNEVQIRSPKKNFIRFDKSIERYILENKIGTPSIGADDLKFKKDKILIRRPLTGDGRLAAALSTDPDHYSDVTVYIINETTEPIKYLLGIINSQLATWYSRKTGIIRFENGQQPQITINKLKEFPIPCFNDDLRIAIIKTVNERLNVSDTHVIVELENQIDQLVYQLYGLTEEEIKIVEGVQ